jgi:CRISPR-associated endonuclease/helicase Cas3
MAGKVCSHPGKPLGNHLFGTLNLALGITDRYNLELSSEQKKALLLHDIAKAHPYFQIRLCKKCKYNNNCATGNSYKSKRHKPLQHAEPSAALVFALTGDVVAAEVVRRHHTGILNIDEVKKFWIDEIEYTNQEETGIKNVISQLLWWEGANKISGMVGLRGHDWSSLLPEYNEWIDMAFDRLDEFDFEGLPKCEKWLFQRIFYSILITSDRWEAVVGQDLQYRNLIIEPKHVNAFLNDKKGDKLFQWRDNVRKRVVENARKVIKSPGIYTLTLPTGTGKTIIGLQLAMDIAERFNASGIIYVLPFVSLVEQNAEVASRLFDCVQEDHHLAYFNKDAKEVEKQYDLDQKFISIFRYWRDPVVVTTMAKLWEVLFSPRGNDSMSFHRLSRTVVLLDEPQSIRAQCWEGFGNIIKLLSEKLNTTFILMTATQPEIAKGQELVPKPVHFPKIRHEIQWLKDETPEGKMAISDAATFLDKSGIKNNDTLIVLNTREAALKMYFEIRKMGISPLFLSRWVTPRDRKITIERIKLKEKEKQLRWVVATQVIEAGMDMDFGLVFRDLGPLDSIIQVAGRCNRHGSRNKPGIIYVAELFDEQSEVNRSYCNIYDKVLISQTRNILNEYKAFDEGQCAEIISRYYRAVKGAINQSDLWDNITGGNWGEYIDLFENRPLPEEMLVIDHDGSIHQYLEGVLEMPNSLENVEERRKAFGIIGQNSISVPIKYLEEWQDRLGSNIWDGKDDVLIKMAKGIWLLKPEGLGKIYRSDICFIPPKFSDEYEFLLD